MNDPLSHLANISVFLANRLNYIGNYFIFHLTWSFVKEGISFATIGISWIWTFVKSHSLLYHYYLFKKEEVNQSLENAALQNEHWQKFKKEDVTYFSESFPCDSIWTYGNQAIPNYCFNDTMGTRNRKVKKCRNK